MPDWIRVKDKTTKHEYTIDRANLTDAVEEIDKKATGAGVLPPTPHVSLSKAKKAGESSTPGGDSATTKEKGSS
jgi:hypothetical protein